MIRRDPTLIPMTDNDVQDVRDMLAARQKEAALQKTEGMLKDGATGVPGFAAQEEARKKKDVMTKNERLGL
ncbi:hypothetical protein PsYK624_083400 [Phanerochaete sordida]|uniref:Uncharacterized protein n=1 Tax=Phanerochaete sordida TaxID=48140 RepID=A0A9P3GAG1_9APHY|nr:hypothetical protein PsYK624_083350 [Phanerochaete sordida]GJE92187.1 hypothetical protein PsYK624_083400 [Phanerochaete sordida]